MLCHILFISHIINRSSLSSFFLIITSPRFVVILLYIFTSGVPVLLSIRSALRIVPAPLTGSPRLRLCAGFSFMVIMGNTLQSNAYHDRCGV